MPDMLPWPSWLASDPPLQAVPGAEPLGVKLKGDHYVVRLKQGGTVIQVLVDATTGQVSQ